MIFVDTNYFLRFFLNDVSPQYQKAKKIFQQGAKEEKKLFTNSVVFFEVYWVFTSAYKKSKKEVINILDKLLSLKFVQLEEREILQKTLQTFAKTNLELEDCYHLAYAHKKKATAFATFDKKIIKKDKLAAKSS